LKRLLFIALLAVFFFGVGRLDKIHGTATDIGYNYIGIIYTLLLLSYTYMDNIGYRRITLI